MKKIALAVLFFGLMVFGMVNISSALLINFDNIPEVQGKDYLMFFEGDVDGVHFSTPDPYDPTNPQTGWLRLNKGNVTTVGTSSLWYSIFSGVQARGRIKIEFPQLVNFVQITGGDVGNKPDSFCIEAYDSSGNLLKSLDTGLFSGGGMGNGSNGYYVDQATLSVSVPDIKYVYVFATTPVQPGEGGISFDDLVYEYQAVPTTELTADAGENISIYSENVTGQFIEGKAIYTGNKPLQYRWLYGQTVILPWTPVGTNNECLLSSNVMSIPLGTFVLTLEVTDGQVTSSDTMILTVNNSAPNAAVLGGAGTYEIGANVVLSAQVSDYDGDIVQYSWTEGSNILCSGSIKAVYGGNPVGINNCSLSGLSLGFHTLTLEVSDGINNSVSIQITVNVVDSQVPTLAPSVDKSILWPANNNMEDIVIKANAFDNSGYPVTLSASVICNESDGDTTPDWSTPVIDQETGIITLQLRAERSGSGKGREYTITIYATDSSGNQSSTAVKIIVPHDKGKN